MGSPFPSPCERHDNITWLARVPSDNWRDGQECFGCFITAKQREALDAAAEVLVCIRTAHPCGTDTEPPDHPCMCGACIGWRAIRALKEDR